MKKLLSLIMCLVLCFSSVGFVVSPSGYSDEHSGLSISPSGYSTEPGDVNCDGCVDNTDALLVLKYDAGIIDFTDTQIKTADVNGDDYADNTDALLILKFDAGIIDDFTGGSTGDNDVVYHEMLPEAVDMKGREFYILQRWFGYGKETIDFEGEVIWDDYLESGELSEINLAKKRALEAVEKDYNCTIVGEMSTDTAGFIRTYIVEDMLSGAPTIDFCFETYYYYYSLVENGYLADLNTLGVDFSKPWWDQNAVADLSIDNKLFYGLGDINTYDNDGTTALLFNKTLYEKKGGNVDELYRLVEDGQWTFDVFEDIVTGFGSDSNGDGVRDAYDTYGLLTETANLYNHIIAAGEKSVAKNANDHPIFSLDTERVYSASGDAVDLYNNTNDVLVADAEKYKVQWEWNYYEETVVKSFKEGRGLFFMSSLTPLSYFKDMKDDISVLPIPKYDRANERYYTTVGSHVTSCVFVPNTTLSVGEKGKQLGIILDALGAYSKDYVTPKYYEKVIGYCDPSDAKISTMLDIIYASRTFDLGAVYSASWGDPVSLCNVLDKNLQYRVDGYVDIIEIAIEESMTKIIENN